VIGRLLSAAKRNIDDAHAKTLLNSVVGWLKANKPELLRH
jgi:hypothetical protein